MKKKVLALVLGVTALAALTGCSGQPLEWDPVSLTDAFWGMSDFVWSLLI
jgi:hypothetical protein